MIKKCASVKIIYIGLQICATYDGLNRLNSEMLLEEKSNFTQFPLPPSPPHFCILGYLEFLLIMRETRSTKQVPQPFQSFNLPDLPITPPPKKKKMSSVSTLLLKDVSLLSQQTLCQARLLPLHLTIPRNLGFPMFPPHQGYVSFSRTWTSGNLAEKLWSFSVKKNIRASRRGRSVGGQVHNDPNLPGNIRAPDS